MDVRQLTVHMTRQPSKHNAPIVALVPFLALVSAEVIGVENDGYSYNCVFISTSSQWVLGDVGVKVLYGTYSGTLPTCQIVISLTSN